MTSNVTLSNAIGTYSSPNLFTNVLKRQMSTDLYQLWTFYCPLAANSVLNETLNVSMKFCVGHFTGFESSVEFNVFQRTDENDLVSSSNCNPNIPNQIDMLTAASIIKGKVQRCTQTWKLASTPIDLANALVENIITNDSYYNTWNDMIAMITSAIIDSSKSESCLGIPLVDIVSITFKNLPNKLFGSSGIVQAIVNGTFRTYRFDPITCILILIFSDNKPISNVSFIYLNPQDDAETISCETVRINPPVRNNRNGGTSNSISTNNC